MATRETVGTADVNGSTDVRAAVAAEVDTGAATDAGDGSAALRDRYLRLLRDVLTFSLWDGRDGVVWTARRPTARLLARLLARRHFTLVKETTPETRRAGRDWPRLAHTMVGTKRLDNLRFCIEQVLREDVPGDLIETGVWRGGAAIFMRGVLAAYGVTDRVVWLADSFSGLPAPDVSKYPADAGDPLHTFSELAVSLEEVRENFRRYGLLDEQVRFLPGWFHDTLPTAPVERLAVLRLDGDMYGSTIEALEALYPKLSPGGYCIVDDYGAVEGCRRAVEDYRAAHGITAPLVAIDADGVYWRVPDEETARANPS
ncbi:TylF/MycF family methyltransferase [Thermasporomyces composti]|uniref:O-methyltransferase n=1 Tax=Thermasporomyces composti TaxID=696763 RepID=A0A3D9V370_THECX|nr:TylF/MycF family methyltransferase [Thermasporomyces composti]REF35939.1 O-methyltransferase [Thermasporomyces composti]